MSDFSAIFEARLVYHAVECKNRQAAEMAESAKESRKSKDHADLFIDYSKNDLLTFEIAGYDLNRLRNQIKQIDIQSTGPHWVLDRIDDVPTGTSKEDPVMIPARRKADHRRVYLTYEGDIALGRGSLHAMGKGQHC